jgi:hypothetical protein
MKKKNVDFIINIDCEGLIVLEPKHVKDEKEIKIISTQENQEKKNTNRK